MDNLWATWRRDFILGEKPTGCVFCDAPAAADLRASLVVHKGQTCFVILNKYPYNNGHFMVVPYRHIAELGALTADEGAEVFALLQQGVAALKAYARPDGFNLGANLGRVAGAGIDQHLHFHVVPRWNGDTNFMPVLAETKVISEHMDLTWQALHDAFQALSAKP